MDNWLMIILTSGVISAVVSVILDNLYKKKHRKQIDFFNKKENVYINILSYMEMYLNPQYKCNMHIDGYSNHDLIEMTEEEFKNLAKYSLQGFIKRGSLYYSIDVLKALEDFSNDVREEKYLKVIMAMRKDLWNINDSITTNRISNIINKLGELKK